MWVFRILEVIHEKVKLMSDYGIAQICLNGHLITSKSNDIIIQQKFCSRCGESVISTCQACNTPIRGSYRKVSQITPPYFYFDDHYSQPAYCYNCGNAFPWTKRSQEAAFELINSVDSLNDVEKDDFKKSVDDLIKGSPKITIAEAKFKKYTKMAGLEIAKGLKDILVNLVSETIKKSIWPS